MVEEIEKSATTATKEELEDRPVCHHIIGGEESKMEDGEIVDPDSDDVGKAMAAPTLRHSLENSGTFCFDNLSVKSKQALVRIGISTFDSKKMVSFETSDLKKIGKGLTAFGVIFTLVGLMLFFHKGFIAIGNILLLLGVFLIVGPNSTLQFFLKPQNAKGTVALVVGFFLIIMGWPIIGMFVETYGFVFLFWYCLEVVNFSFWCL